MKCKECENYKPEKCEYIGHCEKTGITVMANDDYGCNDEKLD